MAPRLSGKKCKFSKFLLSLNSQKRLEYKANNTKYRSLSRKPRSHVIILIYRTWPIETKTKTLQKLLKFSNCRKSIRKQIRPSCRKTFRPHLCLFGFAKTTKFRDSSEYLQCAHNVLAKSCLPCQILYKPKKIFAERGKA